MKYFLLFLRMGKQITPSTYKFLIDRLDKDDVKLKLAYKFIQEDGSSKNVPNITSFKPVENLKSMMSLCTPQNNMSVDFSYSNVRNIYCMEMRKESVHKTELQGRGFGRSKRKQR